MLRELRMKLRLLEGVVKIQWLQTSRKEGSGGYEWCVKTRARGRSATHLGPPQSEVAAFRCAQSPTPDACQRRLRFPRDVHS